MTLVTARQCQPKFFLLVYLHKLKQGKATNNSTFHSLTAFDSVLSTAVVKGRANAPKALHYTPTPSVHDSGSANLIKDWLNREYPLKTMQFFRRDGILRRTEGDGALASGPRWVE